MEESEERCISVPFFLSFFLFFFLGLFACTFSYFCFFFLFFYKRLSSLLSHASSCRGKKSFYI